MASAEAAVSVAEAGVSEAEARLALAQSELTRAETLNARGVVSGEELDIRRTEAELGQAGRAAAEAEVGAESVPSMPRRRR